RVGDRGQSGDVGDEVRRSERGGRVFAEDLVHRPVCEGDHVQVAVGPGLDVGADAKVSAEFQTLTLVDVMLVEVIRHTILEPGIAKDEVLAIAAQPEAEQMSAERVRRGGSHKKVPEVLPS